MQEAELQAPGNIHPSRIEEVNPCHHRGIPLFSKDRDVLMSIAVPSKTPFLKFAWILLGKIRHE
jgi:hypothetical protein